MKYMFDSDGRLFATIVQCEESEELEACFIAAPVGWYSTQRPVVMARSARRAWALLTQQIGKDLAAFNDETANLLTTDAKL